MWRPNRHVSWRSLKNDTVGDVTHPSSTVMPTLGRVDTLGSCMSLDFLKQRLRLKFSTCSENDTSPIVKCTRISGNNHFRSYKWYTYKQTQAISKDHEWDQCWTSLDLCLAHGFCFDRMFAALPRVAHTVKRPWNGQQESLPAGAVGFCSPRPPGPSGVSAACRYPVVQSRR
jgi:hypothetical protein